MKTINIYLTSGAEVKISEESKKPLDQYKNDLEGIFSSNNVCMIETDKTITLVRPSSVSAIKIEESEDIPDIDEE